MPIRQLLTSLASSLEPAFRRLVLPRLVLPMAAFDHEPVTRQLEGIGIMCKSVTIDVASIPAEDVGVATVAVAGLTPQHRCFVQFSSEPSGAIAVTGAKCADAGTLTVYLVNPNGADAVDLASATFTLFAIPGDLN